MPKNNSEVSLEEIIPNNEQVEILYHQLLRRRHSISYKNLVTFSDHRRFVLNHPYRAWYLVLCDSKPIGSVYVQLDNSIGLNCEEDLTQSRLSGILIHLGKLLAPLPSVASIRRGSFFINVPSSNTALQKTLISLGASEVQRSYLFPKSLNIEVLGDVKDDH